MVVEKELKYNDVEQLVRKCIEDVPQISILKSITHVLKSGREFVGNCDIEKLRQECAELDALHEERKKPQKPFGPKRRRGRPRKYDMN